ncbi:MAG: protein kinase domain-containing protein [Pyrinomonadaceae bacterium]
MSKEATNNKTDATAPKVPKNFFENLKKKYEDDDNLRDAWSLEEPLLKKVISQVAEEIDFNYILEKPLGVGGSGVVSVVKDKNLQRERALKISRPSPGKERLLTQILTSETENLIRLSHPNLIQIFAQGAVELNKQLYPYYVMEFVKGVLDSDQYLAKSGITKREVFQIFTGVLQAVEYH